MIYIYEFKDDNFIQIEKTPEYYSTFIVANFKYTVYTPKEIVNELKKI